jgi:hypothetical protein
MASNPGIKAAAEVSALRVIVSSLALYVKKMANDPNFDSTLQEILRKGAATWRVTDGTPDQVQEFRKEMEAIGREILDQIAKQPI